MNEFVNGIILVLFGGIKLVCQIAEVITWFILATVLAVYLMAVLVLYVIEDACDCVMHHRKPDNFFERPRKLLHLVKDTANFGWNYID